uniref:Uncharacterized protein n=1 Tax=Glossina austeni TaxID=7395 RepID=A0A1A9VPN5_GLOAU
MKFREEMRCDMDEFKSTVSLLLYSENMNCKFSITVKSSNCVPYKCNGGDNSNGFVWKELKLADFSYNPLPTVDTSLTFAQCLQHLNLRHNQLFSVKAIKWLPNLKTSDLSFNRLTQIPQFHMDAYKRLQTLNMSNNLVEQLTGIV